MYTLSSCLKKYTKDQDKAVSPEETVARVTQILSGSCGVLAETERIDTGRLGIPVFVSLCGSRASQLMPSRKQMGKGASPAQAEASALMELVERYSWFSFWEDSSHFEELTWSEALEKWPDQVMDIQCIAHSVNETIDAETAVAIMDLRPWKFCLALNVQSGKMEYVPLDWFRVLNEFNGASAGNTLEESLLQGACELVERHVCAVFAQKQFELPTIDQKSSDDPVLRALLSCFEKIGVRIVLKDLSMGMPVPTVAALAWDPETFPGMSEIVFTAGTSSSPVKAAIRAVTEVAQLAGDFHTGRVYEASGLPKYNSLEQIEGLLRGSVVAMDSLPNVETEDILEEIMALTHGLQQHGFSLYTVSTAHAELKIPANYSFVPGFAFRERAKHCSMGLFVGRMLAEEAPTVMARLGLASLEDIYPKAYFIPFFKGLLALREEEFEQALTFFEQATALQPAAEERALAAFYHGHVLSLLGRWEEMLFPLTLCVSLDSGLKEAHNLLGVARFKCAEYEKALAHFQAALDIDTGQAQVLANLGACHKMLGHKKQAIDYLQSALDMDPSLTGAKAHLDDIMTENSV